MGQCIIETYDNSVGQWLRMGVFEVENPKGAAESTPGWFSYDLDYAISALGREGQAATTADRLLPLSKAFQVAVGGGTPRFETWPAFALDLFPAGSARSHWERLLGLARDDVRDDFLLLNVGAGNPPGHLRVLPLPDVAETLIGKGGGAIASALAALNRTPDWHRHGKPTSTGFSLHDIALQGPEWLDHARRSGAPVSGASGVQGMTPKFLLREDNEGRFHADLECPDGQTRQAIIVKFARPSFKIDSLLIEAEAAYLQIAREIGLSVHGRPRLVEGALVVDRFDRVPTSSGKVIRLGMESLVSLVQSRRFGEHLRMEDLASSIARQSARPERDLVEFFMRDVFNFAIGNTDNHARNTAFLWTSEGYAMSPLFDVAPMALSGEAIPRVCAFESEFQGAEFPDWPSELRRIASSQRTKTEKSKRRKSEARIDFSFAARHLEERLSEAHDKLRKTGTWAHEPGEARERLWPRRSRLLEHIKHILERARK